MGVSAAIAIVGAATVASSNENARLQRREVKKEVKRQEAQFANEQAEADAAEQKSIALKANAEGRRRQRALRAATSGRSSTILTNPGDAGAAPTVGGAVAGQKTLLGS